MFFYLSQIAQMTQIISFMSGVFSVFVFITFSARFHRLAYIRAYVYVY